MMLRDMLVAVGVLCSIALAASIILPGEPRRAAATAEAHKFCGALGIPTVLPEYAMCVSRAANRRNEWSNR